MQEIEALADCLSAVVDEMLSEMPDDAREGIRLAMALFVRSDLGPAAAGSRDLIARVFSVPAESL